MIRENMDVCKPNVRDIRLLKVHHSYKYLSKMMELSFCRGQTPTVFATGCDLKSNCQVFCDIL